MSDPDLVQATTVARQAKAAIKWHAVIEAGISLHVQLISDCGCPRLRFTVSLSTPLGGPQCVVSV